MMLAVLGWPRHAAPAHLTDRNHGCGSSAAGGAKFEIVDQPLDRIGLLLRQLLLLGERKHLLSLVGRLLVLLGVAQDQRIVAARIEAVGLELRQPGVGIPCAR